MILDIDQADPLPVAEHYDVCIAGGGVAGITLALRLAEQKKRVLLLEAGGYEFSEASQAVYRGDNVGYSYHDLETARLRFLGGSSGHWNGQCRPLDSHDFLPRDHIPDSGWPIRAADIEPYLAPAMGILELDDFPAPSVVPESNGYLREITFRWSPPVRFGEKFRQELAESRAIDVFLNANLVEIRIDPASGRVSHFAFQGYAEGKPKRQAAARQFVLALGGIENPRMLLNQGTDGLGNQAGHVGRYFMEHPEFEIGYHVAGPVQPKRGNKDHWLAPTAQMMKDLKVASAGFRLSTIVNRSDGSMLSRGKLLAKRGLCASDIVADLVRSVYPLSCRVQAENAGFVEVSSEQIPNPRSRVRLGEERDRFGLRRAVLDWQLTEFDKRTIRVGALQIAKHHAQRQLGRLKLFDWVLEENAEFPTVESGERVGGYHHMGTTRMGSSAKDGVVDRNCRVFGHDNLYVAGSSVFRTAGQSNPTLAIVQLTLRLADYLGGLDS